MPRQRRPVVVIEGVPDWLVTFGDMMSLLLTFFILLFSVSEIKNPGRIYDLIQTFKAKILSKRPVFGHTLPRMDMGPDGMLNEMFDQPNQMGEAGIGSVRVQNSEGESIHARTIRDNLHLQLRGKVYFEEGEAYLLEEGRRVLKEHVIPALIDGRFKIVILGHAAAGEAADLDAAYFLGFQRAMAIREYLISNEIVARRIEVQSAGPRLSRRKDASNDAVREMRRRVDILISPQLMGPPAEG